MRRVEVPSWVFVALGAAAVLSALVDLMMLVTIFTGGMQL